MCALEPSLPEKTQRSRGGVTYVTEGSAVDIGKSQRDNEEYGEAISNAVGRGKPKEVGILFAGFQNFLQRQEGRKAGCTRRADGALNSVAESSNWLYDRN